MGQPTPAGCKSPELDKARPFKSRHVQLDGARAIPVIVKRARRAAGAAKFA